ncbi:hypothetical protein GQ53DRAFT_754272 [Thozetella sp. PMI_491]|nr:hypothetical protein GQ53DRAFT_754272 [Thozetella sp. PMI_491]
MAMPRMLASKDVWAARVGLLRFASGSCPAARGERRGERGLSSFCFVEAKTGQNRNYVVSRTVRGQSEDRPAGVAKMMSEQDHAHGNASPRTGPNVGRVPDSAPVRTRADRARESGWWGGGEGLESSSRRNSYQLLGTVLQSERTRNSNPG